MGGADAVADAAGVAQAVFPGTADVDPARAPSRWSTRRLAGGRRGRACSCARRCARRSCSPRRRRCPARPGALKRAQARRGAEGRGNAQVHPHRRGGRARRPEGRGDRRQRTCSPPRAAIDTLQSSRRAASRRRTVDRSPPPSGPTSPCRRRARRPSPATRCCTHARPAAAPRPRPRSSATRSRDIFMLGPESVISKAVESKLRKLGTVTRIQGPDAVTQRHRLRPLHETGSSAGASSTPATAWCSRTPTPARRGRRRAAVGAPAPYGPLLLVTDADQLPASVEQLPARHPARLREGPGARRLQSRLVDRRRGRDLDGGSAVTRRSTALARDRTTTAPKSGAADARPDHE